MSIALGKYVFVWLMSVRVVVLESSRMFYDDVAVTTGVP